MSTEIPTTIKKKKIPKCDRNYHIFLLKFENVDYCLKVVNVNSLSMTECNYSSRGQHWTQPRLLGLSASAQTIHICFAYRDQCLTAASPSFMNGYKSLFLKPFYSYEYAWQKWTISDNGQLSAIGLRLVAHSKSHLIPSETNKWEFEMKSYLNTEPLYKWSFLPVQDNNNVTLCAQ